MKDRLITVIAVASVAAVIVYLMFYLWFVFSGESQRERETQIRQVVSTETSDLRNDVRILQTQVAGKR